MNKKITNWSYLQSVEDIDIGRYFEYDADALDLFKKWLSFNSDKLNVLEVGSGSGFFTNILLTLFPNIALTCLEPDENFVQSLERKFNKRIKIIKDEVENNSIEKDTFDIVITHIVLHNLDEPIKALIEIKRILKHDGKVILIEPLPASRNYYPSQEIAEAFEFLFKVVIYKNQQRNKVLPKNTSFNPWNNCYPKILTEAGFRNVECHGWTSIFTLSDNRYDFHEKKKWLKLRKEHLKQNRIETSKILLEMGEKQEIIDNYYKIVFDYFDSLEQMTVNEITTVHEQEILHRIIAIGSK